MATSDREAARSAGVLEYWSPVTSLRHTCNGCTSNQSAAAVLLGGSSCSRVSVWLAWSGWRGSRSSRPQDAAAVGRACEPGEEPCSRRLLATLQGSTTPTLLAAFAIAWLFLALGSAPHSWRIIQALEKLGASFSKPWKNSSSTFQSLETLCPFPARGAAQTRPKPPRQRKLFFATVIRAITTDGPSQRR